MILIVVSAVVLDIEFERSTEVCALALIQHSWTAETARGFPRHIGVMHEEEQFKSRELFGGAILIDVPARFADISDYRPVPDHQEARSPAVAS